jgi:hypothetical protein
VVGILGLLIKDNQNQAPVDNPITPTPTLASGTCYPLETGRDDWLINQVPRVNILNMLVPGSNKLDPNSNLEQPTGNSRYKYRIYWSGEEDTSSEGTLFDPIAGDPLPGGAAEKAQAGDRFCIEEVSSE